MEQGREDAVEEVLYEIRHHARGPLPPDSSQDGTQTSSGSRGGLLSYLSLPGVNQLKERWNECKRPRKSNKRMSLFVSPGGEHVAVAAGNRIVILRKDDDYMEPCGIFICNDRQSIFNNGAWSETQGILGVVDDMSTIYFIKSNGEEITRRTRSQLKLSSPIIDLIGLDDLNLKKSCLYSFCIFTADGLLYHVEVTQETSASIYIIPTSSNLIERKRQFPLNVSCLDFHPDLSLMVLVGPCSIPTNSGDYTGLYSLFLVHLTASSELKLMFCSPQFEGLFCSPKGYTNPLTPPKVAISPQGKFIATLDLTGCIDVFNLDGENYSLSDRTFTERLYLHDSDNSVFQKKNYLNNIVDFTWWTDHILILGKRSGSIIMYDIIRDVRVEGNEPIICMPVIERVRHCQGYVFVLEDTSLEERSSMPRRVEYINMQHPEYITYVTEDQLHTGLFWSLMSFSVRSVSEMYTNLISAQRYQDALEFANRHGLDRDEVFKAQWLHSDHGIYDIDMFLSKIKDQMFVLAECVDNVGPTEEAVKSLVSYGLRITDEYKFSDSDDGESSLIWDFRMLRLQLLQFKDRLETFMGINMGRFSPQEYRKFRSMPLTEVAISLAESGKIGALNLLFKRHPYSLSPSILKILSAIPETVPVQSYGQLLPGSTPPSTIVLRDGDWVEFGKVLSYINKLPGRSEKNLDVRTEYILKLCVGFVWPSVAELSDWYKNRARDIDNLSGQLDNCLSLVEFACRKGIMELQHFFEDILYLHQLTYSDGCDEEFTMSLVTWEQLSDYEKFKMMLKGVKVDMVVERLREKAIPFMQSRFSSEALDSIDQKREDQYFVHCEQRNSFLVRWLKEMAAENRLDICLVVIENACCDSPVDGLFKDEVEITETTLQCIYLCTLTDQWNMMASILSKLPRKTVKEKSDDDFNLRHGTQGFGTPRFSDMKNQLPKSETLSNPLSLHVGDSQGFDDHLYSDVDKLEKRIKVAEGHVEVGRLLAYYQVPKPMSFFLSAQSDEKNLKQLLRLILSKFGRRQPVRSDNDWANMWRDMQCFQERAFPFLDLEYMLVEFCRGLLKAGKFSLARNYLKGTGSIALAPEKAENLVIQSAREYFFSASSLDCNEIWRAKECLSLFPNSKSVQAEADTIDALTIRLPNLGVTLLPMEFRQIRNPMEIINIVIASQSGAYLDVEELIEIAKLLGLSSQDDIAAVEEAVAREAAVAGDMQLAFDLCLVLAKKGHGPIWDLCAAIAKGPHLDNMDSSSRKQLLGFALSHCDEESIGELLHAWKDIEMHMQYEQLMTSTGTCPLNFSIRGSSIIPLPIHSIQDIFNLRESSEPISDSLDESRNEDPIQFESIKEILSKVAKDLSTENGVNWDSLLREDRKALSFAAFELPWLLELTGKEEYGKKAIPGTKSPCRKHYIFIRMQALVGILCWLAGKDMAPTDDLIASLAKFIMEPPVTEEEDVLGCSFLLNLMNAFHGVEIIEEQLKQREEYQEIYSIMNIGMMYSSLHNSLKECSSPEQRRKLLLCKFHEQHAPFSSDEMDQIDRVQSTFWREWKTKLEEQKRLADQARSLEQIIPGVETVRFLSGDIEYIKGVVFSFIDSIKVEKKHILKEAIKLADTYGLHRTEVLLRFFGCALVSEHWKNEDILEEISEFREDIVSCARGVIDMVCSVVYPEINGHNKLRLSYIYSILSACYMRLKKTEEPALILHQDQGHKHILEPFQFYKVLEQECRKVSFISELDFKNIAGLDDLNFEHFNEEIYNNIHESTVDAVADMVRTLVGIYKDSQDKGLISWQDVYKHHVLSLLASLETGIEARYSSINADELQILLGEIDLNYDVCQKYIKDLSEADTSYILGRFCMLCLPCNLSGSLADDSAWKDCLTMLLNFWIEVVNYIQETVTNGNSQGKLVFIDAKHLSRCLQVFKGLLMEGEISVMEGWNTVSGYSKLGIVDGLTTNISFFLKAMIFSGCGYKSIAQVYSEAELGSSLSSGSKLNSLQDLYVYLTETVFLNLSRGTDEHQNLHHLISSLSRFERNHIEDLKKTRCVVWGKLSAFSNDMQLESHIRVYALELMQSVMGKNFRSLPVKLTSEIEPWEAWNESCGTNTSASASASASAEQADVSTSITSNLVALKSTRLLATISPDFNINPEDLMTVDSAVSCFLRLCETASIEADINVLQAVLDAWEELFPNRTDTEKASESHEELNNWSSDEWGDGWESLSEEPVSKEEKQDGSISVRPLHACWMEIIKRLVMVSEPGVVIEMLDRSLSKPGVLLDEDETHSLFQLVAEKDCFMALKMLLLLPYEPPQLQCLRVVESKLRKGGFLTSTDDYELLTLILFSGVLQVVATDPAFGKLLSHCCYLVGHLARLCQEDLLKCSWDHRGRPSLKESKLFSKVLLPCFTSELVKAGQYLLAGFVVSRWMHAPASLGLMDVMEPSLRRYLEGQILQVQPQGSDGQSGLTELDSCGSLVYTVSSLRVKVGSMLQSALSAFPTNTSK